jgi:hypothetical protein
MTLYHSTIMRLASLGMLAIAAATTGAAAEPTAHYEGDECYICTELIMSSCGDWTEYHAMCQGACGTSAASCTSNGCPGGLYKIECEP